MSEVARGKSNLVPGRPGWRVRVVFVSVAITLLPMRSQAAGSPDAAASAVAQATALNREALAYYERGDFEEARKVIKQALAVCGDGAALERHPVCARTWLNLGVVLVGGLQQPKEGIAAFREALARQPGITLNPDLASPELRAAFDEAHHPSPDATTAGAAKTNADSRLVHTPVTEGQRGSAISITVVVPDPSAFDRLVLAYRKAEGEEFLGRPMKPAPGGSYTAEIPASATSGAAVAYFIEAVDAEGDVVAARGSVQVPLVIALVGDRQGGAVRRGESDEGDAELPARWVLVAFTMGSGVGVASGTGDLNADVMTARARLAPARLLHLSPEAGLWISRSLLLSLQARLQLVTGTTDLIVAGHRYHAAGRAAALFARASWLFRPRSDFQPLFSLALGVGEIRHVVTFEFSDCGDDHRQRCVDTVTAGPFLAGAGTGFLYAFNQTIALLVQLNAQLAAPRSTLNFDANLGAAARF